MSETTNSHLFAVRTTGGQEKVVLRLLETKMRSGGLDIQSILLVDNLKGYIVIEAEDPQIMFNAIQGLRHVKGQLRGELQYSCLLYTSPSPRDISGSRMPSSA